MFIHDIGGRQKLSGKMVNMWQILIEMVVVYWAYVDLSFDAHTAQVVNPCGSVFKDRQSSPQNIFLV